MAIKKLRTNYVTDEIEESVPKRKYQITNNSDGSVYIDDVTKYSKKGSDFDADDINATNKTINEIIDVIESNSGFGDGETPDKNTSVTANVEKLGNTVTITITDKNGTTIATVTDGQDGNDGYSPTITENSGNTDDIYKLDIKTKLGSFTTPNLKGANSSGNDTEMSYEEALAVLNGEEEAAK